MTMARWVFLIAGIYGMIVLTPQFFLEQQIGADNPPAITHPEFFYGFIGVALAWQVMFLIIASDPMRFRLAMLPAVLEKMSFALAVMVLCMQKRVDGPVHAFALVDAVWGILFAVAFVRTRPKTV